MIISAHQPAYLPWLGLFHKIAISDNFVILDSVQFEKNSFINRNRIKTPRGPEWLTVPVLIKGHIGKTIRDMEINNSTNWRSDHWKSIYLNYKKAKYFQKYGSFFEGLYKKEWIKLYDLLEYTLHFFINELKISTKLYKQSELGIFSKKEELILDLCRQFNAQAIVFGVLGKDYVDIEAFRKNGIEPIFQDYRHPIYSQLREEFVPNLSVIDLLFNAGPEESKEVFMNNNITKDSLKEKVA